MKTIKFFVLTGALLASVSASAQFANTSNKTQSNTQASTVGAYKDVNPYDRISVSFLSEKISPDKGDDTSMSGASINYIHGFSVSKTLPLFIETGIDFSAGFHTEDMDKDALSFGANEGSVKTSLMSLAIPANLAYKFNVNPEFSIQPFVGLNFKFNLIGKQKTSYEFDDPDDEKDYEEMLEENDIKADKNMFDKKDTGDKNLTWNRFQMGWHIGAGINYKSLWIGLSYGTDFTALCKKVNTSTFKVGVGVNF